MSTIISIHNSNNLIEKHISFKLGVEPEELGIEPGKYGILQFKKMYYVKRFEFFNRRLFQTIDNDISMAVLATLKVFLGDFEDENEELCVIVKKSI